MAILTQLSLTEVADLRAEADAFENHANELKSLTDTMFEIVDGTAAVWSGSAHDQFVAKFDGLQDEMQYLYQMVDEYHTDLIEIASNYETAESDNDSISQALSSDIDLV
jgi:WXG100 family type VII secretion target